MKNILILAISTLLFTGVPCVATNPLSANPTAQPAIGNQAASSTFCAIGEFCSHTLLTPGDGGPAPYCYPGKPCNNDKLKLRAGDGGPAPYCYPGKPCNNDQLKLPAGDGGPAPYCYPGKPCNNDQLKLQAGDGGPAPYCYPGKPCNNDQLKL
ncbi:MAG: hypothetical protein WCC92_21915, partial [Candidatus Korobacteraceae bacterium]